MLVHMPDGHMSHPGHVPRAADRGTADAEGRFGATLIGTS
jgi:hypothetical protein